MQLIDAPLGDPAQLAAYLELERLATDAYAGFVYADAEEASRVQRVLLERDAAEFAPPYGQALVEGDRVLGMFAALTGAELQRRRLKATFALARSGALTPESRARAQLAATTLLKVEPDDLYLASIAVAPAARSRGVGRRLLADVLATAERRGSRRVVLEVAAGNTTARALYAKEQMVQLGEQQCQDAATGRMLSYVHLAAVRRASLA